MLQYEFMQNAFIVGIILALLAPVLWVFLIVRRYTLISDTLSHTSLTGVIIGLVLKLPPLITTLLYSLLMAYIIEKLRQTKRLAGDMVLALILASNLAVVAIAMSMNSRVMLNIASYLFGSIALVSRQDVYILWSVSIVILVLFFVLRIPLMRASYDEDSARAWGMNVAWMNMILIIATSVIITLAIPIIGILLLGSLIVLPVIIALEVSWSFKSTIVIAQGVALFGVIVGIILSYFLNISTSGMIIFVFLGIFGILSFVSRMKRKK